MTENHPALSPHQTTSGRDHFDLVAGEPPVPISVWRTARTSDDTSAGIPARLAARVVAAYSRPGEAIIDLTATHALTAAAQHGSRIHHRAWFTDTATLTVSPPTPTPPAAETTDSTLSADVSGWFGDDLTDPDLPGPADTTPVDSGPMDLPGRISLIAAPWPLEQHRAAANRVRLAVLLATCARLLRPQGCLVLVTTPPAAAPAAPEDFTDVVAAASAIGLGYLQHIVAVAADTDGDQFSFYATDEELLALAQARQPGHPQVHLRVHADLLVFAHRPRRTSGHADG